jgi:hypothetical protein
VADGTKKEKTKVKAKEKTKERSCTIKGCKRPYQAKGYCTAHYHKWRKGELPKPRYQTCQFRVNKLKKGEKKECMKRVFKSGLCADHYKIRINKAAPAASAPASPEGTKAPEQTS